MGRTWMGTYKAEEFLVKEEQRDLSDSQDVAFVQLHKPRDPAIVHDGEKHRVISTALLEDSVYEVDVNEGDLSIEKLNETIKAILKISQEQEQLLMKSPTVPTPGTKNNCQDPKIKAPVHFVEPLSPTGVPGHRKPPLLGQGQNSRSGRAAELKVPKDRQQGCSQQNPNTQCEDTPTVEVFTPEHPSMVTLRPGGELPEKCLFDSYRLHYESIHRTFVLSSCKDANIVSEQMNFKEGLDTSVKEAGLSSSAIIDKEHTLMEELLRSKTSLSEVDLSDLKALGEDGEVVGHESSVELGGDSDQEPGIGFFFKDEQKAEDELAKKRAAFLLKQQRKAEEAHARKQQLEAEVELKRDEAWHKADYGRRRRRRQGESSLNRNTCRGSSSRHWRIKDLANLNQSLKGLRQSQFTRKSLIATLAPRALLCQITRAKLTLASAATTEPKSVHSGGTPSHRVESLEALPTYPEPQPQSEHRPGLRDCIRSFLFGLCG